MEQDLLQCFPDKPPRVQARIAEVFYHELAHAAHARITKLRPGQDAKQEIVAEFVAATLAALDC